MTRNPSDNPTLPPRAGSALVGVRQFLFLFAFAVWLGGFFFYASVVIPMGHEVLGSHRLVGFITQRVTAWLNIVGVGALAMFLWNAWHERRGRSRRLRWGLFGTWTVMAALQIGLFALHPAMDRMLDPAHRRILKPDQFYGLHRIYLDASAAQHLTGLAHAWLVLAAWRSVSTVSAPGGKITDFNDDLSAEN